MSIMQKYSKTIAKLTYLGIMTKNCIFHTSFCKETVRVRRILCHGGAKILSPERHGGSDGKGISLYNPAGACDNKTRAVRAEYRRHDCPTKGSRGRIFRPMNPEMTESKKWAVLVITSLSAFMATLDGSIVNIALPPMATEMHVSISSVQWVVTSYLLTISVLLLVWGRLADMFGKKRIFASGYLMFAVGSALCSLSHSLPLLVGARVMQAVGASAMMSLSQGIVTGTFPSTERGRALGFVGAMVALGNLVGPSLGGVLVHAFGWPSIFIINVPIGAVGAVLAFLVIPEIGGSAAGQTYDFGGTWLFACLLLVLFPGLLLVQQGTLPVWAVLPTLAVSAGLFVLLIVRERHTAAPLINLELFHIPEFSFGLTAAFLSFISINATLLFMPFYLQDLRGFSPLAAGLIISAYPITYAVMAPLSGWLSDRITYRPLTVGGMAAAGVALLLLATLRSDTPIPLVVAYLVLMGGGAAAFQSPNNSSVMGCVPRSQLGIAGGINALFRNLGMVTGTTLSVLIFAFRAKLSINSLSGSQFSARAFLAGLSAIFLFNAACSFGSMLLSLTRAVAVRPGEPSAPNDSGRP